MNLFTPSFTCRAVQGMPTLRAVQRVLHRVCRQLHGTRRIKKLKMIIKLLFHLLAALQFGFGCYYDYVHVQIPSSSTKVHPFGGKFKYLTYLNAMLQTLYFTIAVVNDVIGSNDSTPSPKPLIRRLKDTLFSSLVFPLAMFVGTTFWGIYAVDRELILPRSLDPYFPLWLNHVMHSNIMVFSMLELICSFRMYPTRRFGLSVLSAAMLSYMAWVHVIYYNTGSWVYPILRVLNWPLRIVFYLASFGLVCGMYHMGEVLNRNIWSKEIRQTVRSSKKKVK